MYECKSISLNCNWNREKLTESFERQQKWLSTFSELKYMTFSSFPTLQEQQTAIESILDIDIRHQIERVDIRADSSLINIHLELFPAGLLSEEHNVWGKEGEKVLIIFHFCSFSKDSYFLCTWIETKLACSLLDIRKNLWLFLDRTHCQNTILRSELVRE